MNKTEIAVRDPFKDALAAIKADLPKEFRFEVDAHMFRDVGSMQNASRIRNTMEGFKHEAVQLGYVVDTFHDNLSGRWCYHLRLGENAPNTMGRLATPPPVPALPVVYELHGLDTQDQVRFYEHDFYPLSNFSAFAIMWKGIKFDTTEAAYHWEKFPTEYDIRNAIQAAMSAHEAFKLAEKYRPLRRPDWDDVKVQVMREILWQKVAQHEYVVRKLLATGERHLVEDSWRDNVWGWGADQKGQNLLGNLWMEIRKAIQRENGRVIPPGVNKATL